RHRAILFGLLGVLLVYAAFQPPLQTLAIIAGLVSVVSFIAIAWSVGGYNEPIRRVIIADIIALVALIAAGAIHDVSRHQIQPGRAEEVIRMPGLGCLQAPLRTQLKPAS